MKLLTKKKITTSSLICSIPVLTYLVHPPATITALAFVVFAYTTPLYEWLIGKKEDETNGKIK